MDKLKSSKVEIVYTFNKEDAKQGSIVIKLDGKELHSDNNYMLGKSGLDKIVKQYVVNPVKEEPKVLCGIADIVLSAIKNGNFTYAKGPMNKTIVTNDANKYEFMICNPSIYDRANALDHRLEDWEYKILKDTYEKRMEK